MKYSSLTNRVAPAEYMAGVDPWEVHNLAMQRIAAGADIALLSIGQEADFCTAPVIVDSAVHSLHSGRHHYSDVSGEPALRAAIADYHYKLTKQTVAADNCTVYAGAQNALFAVAQVLLEATDEVILSEPYYTTYRATFSASGATVVSVPVSREKQFRLQPDDLISAITNRTRVIVLNTPNNPMGSCYTAADFEQIVAICVSRKIWLVLDIVYADIVDPAMLFLPHQLPGADSIVITVGSLSKSHRMTGWRIGWAIGAAPLSSHLYNLSLCMHYGLPPFIMDAATTAIQQATHIPIEVRSMMAARRAIVHKHLLLHGGARLYDARQGMFMLLDVHAMGQSARSFALSLLDQESVAVLPCDGFGESGCALVRLGLCIDDKKLADACDRISYFLENISR